jgi:hypothetical protein
MRSKYNDSVLMNNSNSKYDNVNLTMKKKYLFNNNINNNNNDNNVNNNDNNINNDNNVKSYYSKCQ